MTEKSRRGFAAMDPTKQREIASKGGKAAHAKGRAHVFTPEQAREAGRKGGMAAHSRNRALVEAQEPAAGPRAAPEVPVPTPPPSASAPMPPQ